ncbi:ecto-NOX disulfide-thiol exchanger 1 [Trichonephila clavipes]|nr:ecto-NOX disulfide-thiol exchanger 1 [Trichonephila clavipes]
MIISASSWPFEAVYWFLKIGCSCLNMNPNQVLIPLLPGGEVSRRPKPDGCRTVYVGILSEKITEDIIKEAFERCGNQEAISVNDKLHCEEIFKEGARILVTWLNRGGCSKQNGSKSTKSYVQRLTKEKSRCEEEVKKAREKLDIVASTIQLQLSKIEKVNADAKVRKNWDHFLKGQRRQIDDWEKKITSFSADLISVRVEEGMDLDMDENAEECGNEDLTVNDELYQLRESYGTLKQQLILTKKELDDYKQNSDYARKDVSVTNSSTQCVLDKVDVTENETCLGLLSSLFCMFILLVPIFIIFIPTCLKCIQLHL